jgi:hypothetical protein
VSIFAAVGLPVHLRKIKPVDQKICRGLAILASIQTDGSAKELVARHIAAIQT